MITDYVVMITAVTVCAVCFIVKQFIPEKYEKFIPLGAGVLGVLFGTPVTIWIPLRIRKVVSWLHTFHRLK